MILVTGATGTVGRQTVSQLLRAGAEVRAMTRHPDAAPLPGDVDVVGGHLSEGLEIRGRAETLRSTSPS
jgi:uncharacterized protein YbjT (DUF2867 family)